MDATRQYYRIAGMPLAMQVWLYECCSSVDPKIAVKESSRIPRLLNWRTIDKRPYYDYLMEGMFRDNNNPSTYRNISPTLKEIAFLQIPSETGEEDIHCSKTSVDEDEDDIFTSIPPAQMLMKKGGEKKQADVSILPPKKKRKQHVGESSSEKISLEYPVTSTKVNTNVPTPNIQRQPKVSFIDGAADETPSVVLPEKQSIDNDDEIVKLREDLDKLKDSVFAELKDLKLLILENFKELRDAINVNRTTGEATRNKTPSHMSDPPNKRCQNEANQHPKATNTHADRFEIPPSDKLASNEANIRQSVQADQIELSEGLHNANIHKISAQMDDEQHGFASPIQEAIEQNVHAIIAIQPDSQFELLDELLPSLNQERTSVAQLEDVVYDATPVPIQRIGRSGSLSCSPYPANCGSSTGSSLNVIRIYEKKHPFVCDGIQGPHNYDLFEDYANWLREGLLSRHKHKTHGEDHYKKNKATLLVPMDLGIQLITDKNWFYTFSFEGQILNDGHIDVILYYLRKKNKYNINNRYKYTTVDCLFNTKIAKLYDEYADVSSETCVAKEDRVIREYINGYRLMAAISWNTVDRVFIPVNVKEKSHWVLAVLTFAERRIDVYDSYRSAGHDAFVRREIHKLAQLLPTYLSMYSVNSMDDTQDQNIPFDINYVDGIPQQIYGSMDCGLHLLAYAEYLSEGDGIPVELFDAELLRIIYGALLWDYASKKAEAGAVSDNEAPARVTRPQVEIANSEWITIS